MNRVAATKTTNITMAEILRGWRCTSPLMASAASKGGDQTCQRQQKLGFHDCAPEDLLVQLVEPPLARNT